MSDLDLAPIKERMDKATPNSWTSRGRAPTCCNGFVMWADVPKPAIPSGGQQIAHFLHERDAEFCAHAHQDIPELVAAYEEKCEEVERLRKGLRICKRSAELAADLIEKRAPTVIESHKAVDALLRTAERANDALERGC